MRACKPVATAIIAIALGTTTATAGVINGTADRTIFLETGDADGSPTNVAYHPDFDQYYTSNGGNPAFSAWVFDALGVEVQALSPSNVDARSWYYNPNTAQLEVVRFSAPIQDIGLPGIDGAGMLSGGYSNLVAELDGSPDVNAMPAYDPLFDVLYARTDGAMVNIIRRDNGDFTGSRTLDLGAAGVSENDLTDWALGFDASNRWFIVTDAATDRALVFDQMDGSYLGASQLDIDVDGEYRMGYTNGQLFVYDEARDGWQGYDIKAVPEPAAMTLLGIAGLVGLRRRRLRR